MQTFRQYPRAGMQITGSCRKLLSDGASSDPVLAPDELVIKMRRLAKSENWTVQTKLAAKDMAHFYARHYDFDDNAHNSALLLAMVEGILAAGKVQE